MKSALLLGGTQFVGKRLVELLLNQGVTVTIATRGRAADDFGDRVLRLKLDRTDEKSVKEALHDKSYDVVFDHTCYSPVEVREVLEALDERIGKYVFISTVAVYDEGEQLVEQDFDPRHFDIHYKPRQEYVGMIGYQEAKRASEAVLYQQAPCPVVTVRFPFVVGLDDYTERFAFHVRAVKQGNPIGTTNRNAKFGFIDSADAAAFLLKVAQSDFEGPINAGSEGSISIDELLDRIAKRLEKSYSYAEDEMTNRSPYDLGISLAQTTALAHTSGYHFKQFDALVDEQIALHRSEK
ncbi:NAD-dependent epimerase/dehydratase family protein [Chryseomicrobium sp. FSL W7-1435]|uniref:NAD-dependent epimerase/dehydratase family protein n=1 Tax=Chryseomicrobium sp. FSL W7-1435 TaxID=2921704 RepID=UPI00315B3685